MTATTPIIISHPFNGLFQDILGKPAPEKLKPSGFYWSKRWGVAAGISWAICKSFAPRSRQITTSVPHHSVFTGQTPFPPPNQQHQRTSD